MHRISSVRSVGNISGKGLTTQWDVSGTDLGIPVYSPTQGRMYFLFGDTFGVPRKKPLARDYVPDVDVEGRNWRGTIAGYTTNFDFSEGIQWDGFLCDDENNARALIPALYCKNDEFVEVTKISQGGVEVDGSLYVFYESIRHWVKPSGSGKWDVNYTGAIKSVDGGNTFERVYDLTWVESSTGEYAKLIKDLAEQDMNGKPSGFDLDLASHEAPSFGQVFALDGKDGYIYLYGRHGGRIHGIKVCRVRRKNIEVFTDYEYLTRFTADGACWVKGAEGLRVVLEKRNACDIIQAPTSNMSVSYNAYLDGWLMTWFKPNVGIVYALSDTPYGPFSQEQIMLPIDHPVLMEQSPKGGNRLYGGFAHELMNAEQGRKVRLVISQWYDTFYNSRLIEICFDA